MLRNSKRASFVIGGNYCNNDIFNLSSDLNRDNCFYPYFSLKSLFNDNGYDLSTYDINSIEGSKIVIYNDMPNDLPKEKDISKSYLIIFESEIIKPENWDTSRHRYFNRIFTWNDDVVDNIKYFKINFTHLFPESINTNISNRKLCALIAANKKVSHPLELYTKRREAIRWFEKKHLDEFDFYGMGWDEHVFNNKYIGFVYKKSRINSIIKPNYPSYKGHVISKKETLQKYKFAICYENAKDISGYITEKIFDCFFSGCIPVYWGADNVTRHIPEACFVDKNKYRSYEELYDSMLTMSEKKYKDYLKNIKEFIHSDESYQFRAECFSETIVKNILSR